MIGTPFQDKAGLPVGSGNITIVGVTISGVKVGQAIGVGDGTDVSEGLDVEPFIFSGSLVVSVAKANTGSLVIVGSDVVVPHATNTMARTPVIKFLES